MWFKLGWWLSSTPSACPSNLSHPFHLFVYLSAVAFSQHLPSICSISRRRKMVCNSVDPSESTSRERDAYWVAFYYPLLIMLFSVLCQSNMQEMKESLAPNSASTSAPNEYDSSGARDLSVHICSRCSAPYSADTAERRRARPRVDG